MKPLHLLSVKKSKISLFLYYIRCRPGFQEDQKIPLFHDKCKLQFCLFSIMINKKVTVKKEEMRYGMSKMRQ